MLFEYQIMCVLRLYVVDVNYICLEISIRQLDHEIKAIQYRIREKTPSSII